MKWRTITLLPLRSLRMVRSGIPALPIMSAALVVFFLIFVAVAGFAWHTKRPEVWRQRDVLTGLSEWALSMVYSPDGRLLATANYHVSFMGAFPRGIQIWDLSSGDCRTFPNNDVPSDTGVKEVIFTHDGRELFAEGPTGIGFFDVRTGAWRSVESLSHGSAVLAMSAGGAAAVQHRTSTISLYNLAGQPVRHFSSQQDLFFIATVMSDWRTALSSDGGRFAAVADDGSVRVYHRDSAETTMLEIEGKPRHLEFSRRNRYLAVTSVTRSADSSGPMSMAINLYDFETEDLLPLDGQATTFGATAFSSDGKLLAAASGIVRQPWWNRINYLEQPAKRFFGPTQIKEVHQIRVWDTRTRRLRAVFEASGNTLADEPPRVTALAFSLDGRTLATACDDESIRLWEVPR